MHYVCGFILLAYKYVCQHHCTELQNALPIAVISHAVQSLTWWEVKELPQLAMWVSCHVLHYPETACLIDFRVCQRLSYRASCELTLFVLTDTIHALTVSIYGAFSPPITRMHGQEIKGCKWDLALRICQLTC